MCGCAFSAARRLRVRGGVPAARVARRQEGAEALVGRKVLTAQLEDDACGWYIGTVLSSAVGKAWKTICPTRVAGEASEERALLPRLEAALLGRSIAPRPRAGYAVFVGWSKWPPKAVKRKQTRFLSDRNSLDFPAADRNRLAAPKTPNSIAGLRALTVDFG